MVRLALVYSPLQHEPSRIVDIDFVQPKHGKEHLQDKVQNPAKRQKISPTKINEQKGFIDGLQSLSPRSSILSVTTLRYGPQLNTSVARSLPPTIMSLQHIHYEQLTKNQLEEKCEEILQHGLKISQHESEYLSEATRLQADSVTPVAQGSHRDYIYWLRAKQDCYEVNGNSVVRTYIRSGPAYVLVPEGPRKRAMKKTVSVPTCKRNRLILVKSCSYKLSRDEY